MSPTPQADRAGIIALPLWPAYICFLLIFMRENEWRLQKFPRGLKAKRNKTESSMAVQRLAHRRAAPAPELVASSLWILGTWGQILSCNQSRGAGDSLQPLPGAPAALREKCLTKVGISKKLYRKEAIIE